MKPVVDPDLCTGCGLCEEMCPEVFLLDDEGIARVIDEDPEPEAYSDIEECVELCPVDAISVTAS
ncbi:MAG: ferredoxin [Coriobacteriia bacterium]|nr:ferredoxin [Coriobacteriia bacterium]